MDGLIFLPGIFCSIATVLHFASIATVIARLRNHEQAAPLSNETNGVTIVRPVCGIENFIETLRTTFRLDYSRYEILFCVADTNDPAVPIVRGLMAEHPHIEARLLIGRSDVSTNPKLNNLVKGCYAARYNWILMVDSNVLMPTNHIQCMLSAWWRRPRSAARRRVCGLSWSARSSILIKCAGNVSRTASDWGSLRAKPCFGGGTCSIGWAASRRLPAKWPKMLPQPRRSGNWA
jgi:cellulose synthase/poly-beta-1,6-N-acetylglucosamine synthase-like glycosyltransferase